MLPPSGTVSVLISPHPSDGGAQMMVVGCVQKTYKQVINLLEASSLLEESDGWLTRSGWTLLKKRLMDRKCSRDKFLLLV